MTKTPQDKTREAWLHQAIDHFRPRFEELGAPLPEVLHVSVGWPSAGGKGTKTWTAGECHPGHTSADGNPQIFISPRLGSAFQALEVLVHELVHASGRFGHGKPFSEIAKPLGLVNKMTHAEAGEELKAEIFQLINELGVFPHSQLAIAEKAPEEKGTPKTSRMRKVWCEDTGYTLRTTRKWLKAWGAPLCPCHQERMMHDEDLDDDEDGE
jgi:hypothetical protein